MFRLVQFVSTAIRCSTSIVVRVGRRGRRGPKGNMKKDFWIDWQSGYKHRHTRCEEIHGAYWNISNEVFTEHAESLGVEMEREECPECW